MGRYVKVLLASYRNGRTFDRAGTASGLLHSAQKKTPDPRFTIVPLSHHNIAALWCPDATPPSHFSVTTS